MSYVLPADVDERPISVVGGGTLGRRIALILSAGGSRVQLFSRSAGSREAARRFVDEHVAAVRERFGLAAGPPGTVELFDALEPAVARAWLVVESVSEDLAVKRQVFHDLDRFAESDAILGTNSSSFPSSHLLDAVAHPERLLNVHFQMPPDLMAVELMSCGHTDPAVIDVLVERLPRYGLVPFTVMRESVGFLFNRIWHSTRRECLTLVAEGVSTPEQVDHIWRLSLGTQLAPFRLMDRIGLDVVLAVEEHYAAIRDDLPSAPRELLRDYVDKGFLGVKSAGASTTTTAAERAHPADDSGAGALRPRPVARCRPSPAARAITVTGVARAELMQRILASRAAAADDVAALRGDLDAVAHGLATLAAEASGLLDRTADPEAVAGLTATLQLTPSVLETISAEQLALDRLQRRLRRRTLNVGVIGRGRQGKSRFLQSLTGLSAREIPTSSGGFCTGVPSEIVAGPAASATVEFRTADSFLREVVAPYYEELGLGPAPRTLAELSPPDAGDTPLPELPAGRAALLDELHRLIAAVPRIRHLFGAPARTIAPEEVAGYVAQADSEGRPQDTYRAVARLRLVAPFPHNEVSQVAVLDLPGLGDTNLTDVPGLLRALSDDVDVLVMVRLPAEKGDDWLDVDYQLYGHAEVALPDVPMELRAFAVLNVDPKSGNGANARRMCDALPGTRLRFSGAAVVDCASPPEVSAFLDLVLDHLARTGAQADSRLVAARARDVQVVLAQVSDVVGHAALVTALQPSAQAARDIVEFGRQVIDELWTALEGLLGELRDERGRPDSVLASAVRVVLDKARDDKGLPSVDQVVERIGRRGSRVGAYSDLLNEARAHLARHFVELDPALSAILDTLRDRLAAVLRTCGRLGPLAPSTDARFLAELERELGQVLPEDGVLRDALRTLDGTRLHYRGFLQHRIRACLDALNADRPLYPTKEVADATAVQIRDAVEATYDSALGEVERLLHGVEAEPSEAIFTLGEEFVDHALRSRGAESEWRTVYLHYRNRIWAEHFSALAAGTADMRRWTETLHETRAQAARLAERVDAALTASGAAQ